MEAAEKHRVHAVLLSLGLIVVGLSGEKLVTGVPVLYVAESILRGVHAWCWLIAILGFGRRYLTINNRFLTYANEAVLPFYILHQTVIVSIAFYLVDWQASVFVKYLFLRMTSFVVIVGLYEGIVKRISPDSCLG